MTDQSFELAGTRLRNRPRPFGNLPCLKVHLAAPRGFCAGVRRAIDAVLEALKVHGPPVYVRRPIVHNMTVVRDLEARGVIFVEELSAVPEHAVVILSAHGSPPQIMREARERNLIAYDAACPLVLKVHREVLRHHLTGRHVLLIGHEGHPEIAGTMGQLPEGAATLIGSVADAEGVDPGSDVPLAYAVQTTYSTDEAGEIIEALNARHRDLAGPSGSDICYATTNRQNAVRKIAPEVDAIIVAGEDFSSNACRLAEVAKAAGCPSVQLVSDAGAIQWDRLPSSGSVGITAAASTPESVVEAIIEALGERFALEVLEAGTAEENTIFKPVRIG